MSYQTIILDSAPLDKLSNYKSILDLVNNDQKVILLVDGSASMQKQLIQIAKEYVVQNLSKAISSFQLFIESTTSICNQLFATDHSIFSDINDLFVEIEWILEDEIMDDFAYYHDQITSIGPLIQSKIVTAFLIKNKINAKWVDTRDLIITDENYQNPNIISGLTKTNIQSLAFSNPILVLPNRIGATLNITTTTFAKDDAFLACFKS